MKNLIVRKGNASALVTTKGGPTGASKKTSEKKNEANNVPKDNDVGAYPFRIWGDNNLWPQDTYDKIKANDLAPTVLDWRSRAMYSGGLIYGFEYVENGKLRFERFQDAEIEAVLEETAIHLYLTEASHDLYTYGNIYPKLIKNNARTLITGLYEEDASMCRMGHQGKAGRIEEVFVSANWRDNQNNFETKYMAIDPYGPIKKSVEQAGRDPFIMPLFRRINGNISYEVPPYYGLINSGWLDFANQIPQWKKAFMENAATLRWHIEIHEKYWEKRYKNWRSLSQDEQIDLQQTEIEEFIESMIGNENAGKAFMTSMIEAQDPTKPDRSLWKITNLNPKKEGGEWLEDSQEADFHIMRAFGVDPTLIGQTPGSKMGSGSGSDKRVAFNQYLLLCKPHQDRIMMPLQVMATFNNWHKKAQDVSKNDTARLRFMFNNVHVATLNTGTETQESIIKTS